MIVNFGEGRQAYIDVCSFAGLIRSFSNCSYVMMSVVSEPQHDVLAFQGTTRAHNPASRQSRHCTTACCLRGPPDKAQ